MKKIFFVALSATLLAAGCQKTEVLNPVGEPAMVFTTGMNKLTKSVGTADADSDGTVNLKAQDFRVWAYADYEDDNTSGVELDQIYDGMENLAITYTETTSENGEGKLSSWAPAKEYYWPGTGKNLRFFAVSGVNLGEDLSETEVVVPSISRTETAVTPSLVVNNFVVDHESPNADLMVADFVCQNQTNKEVALKFRHTLSKVQFLFKTTAASERPVFVQSLKVENINTKSTLTVTDAAADAGAAARFAWAAGSAPQAFTDDYTTEPADFPTAPEYIEGKAADKTALKLTTNAEKFATWQVIPQSISGLKVNILYIIGERQFESIFTLSTENLTAWAPNQYIRYTVTLAPNVISFVPSVEDWDQYDADNATEGDQDIEMEN